MKLLDHDNRDLGAVESELRDRIEALLRDRAGLLDKIASLEDEIREMK